MLKKDNRSKVLGLFFDDPLPEGIGFQLREISRIVGLAPKSVKAYLEELKKEGLILQKEHRIHKYPIYYANREGGYFIFLKRLDMMCRIKESGLLDHLDKACMPEVILLFGSASRGEDVRGSDIDLFLQCPQKNMDVSPYERVLKRRVNLFFEKKIDKLSEELKNNLVNGDKLKGYLRVKFQKWKKA